MKFDIIWNYFQIEYNNTKFVYNLQILRLNVDQGLKSLNLGLCELYKKEKEGAWLDETIVLKHWNNLYY